RKPCLYWSCNGIDRSSPGDVAGGDRQRLPGGCAAVLGAVAAGANHPGRNDRRRVRPRREAGASCVLPAVPAATAVSRWLAHSQGRPVSRQRRHHRAGTGLAVFTIVCLGFLIHWMIPSMPLAVAFALAALV